jgi:phosphatidylinositol-3-phosphatase
VKLDPLRRWEQRFGSLPLPSPLLWAVLAAAFLGFGVLMGRVAGPDAVGALASARAPVKLIVAQAAVGGNAGSGSSTAAKPPPAPEAETTPEPSPTPPATTKSTEKAAASKSSSSSSSGSSSASGESSSGTEGASGASPGSSGAGQGGAKAKLPAVKHVFVVMLDEQPYATAFGPASPAHYLTGTLEKRGKLLVRYYAVAHEGLADGIALLSGQGPTEATAANCPVYREIAPASAGADGQVLGQGCLYPPSTQTLMSQLAAKHLTWKAYVEGIDEGAGTPSACAHPAPGATDSSASLAPGGTAPAYQTWRNPFVYFGSIAGSSACASHDVGMRALRSDLAGQASTPSFSYIAPGPCADGSPTPCAPGKAWGMAAADAFLQTTVPQILASKAYKKDGMLAITVDNAPSSGEYADSSSCCGQPRFPNLPAPTGALALHGGGQVGLLLLSPFIKKGGGLAQETYDHFSLLATLEQLFGLSKLGYAGLSEVKPFSASLFSGG